MYELVCTACNYIVYYTALDPALVSLSLLYVSGLTDFFAYTLRLSSEIENLVSSKKFASQFDVLL